MYPTLNSIQVHCKTLSTHERLKLLTVIKSIGSDRKPVAPTTSTNEAFTPHVFFQYVVDLIVNVLMLIELLDKLKGSLF